MKMKTKMSILDQELSQSAVGVYKILRKVYYDAGGWGECTIPPLVVPPEWMSGLI